MRHVMIVLGILFVSISQAGPFSEFPILTGPLDQQMPDIDGTVVVWQEDYDSESTYDWNIIARDISWDSEDYFVFGYEVDQDINPAISGNKIVWEYEYSTTDHDVWLGDLETGEQTVVTESVYNEACPDIHGNLVVWQERYEDGGDIGDWNIYSADILNPAEPNLWPVSYFTEDQTAPAVYRSEVVYEDFYTPQGETGSWDITLTDTWMRDDPTHTYLAFEAQDESAPAIDGDLVVYQFDYYGDGSDFDLYLIDRSDRRQDEFKVVSNTDASEMYPDVSGNLVVWQDDRNGNWDIYGQNLITGQTFQITDDPADQVYPAISGDVVVWQDEREGISQIYGAVLTGDTVAVCDTPLAGDVDGNCQVDLADFAQMAQNWMACGLDPVSACTN